MAKDIRVRVAGGNKIDLPSATTVQDAANQSGAASGYTANVNGEPADFSDALNDDDVVTFAKAVKGG